MKKIMTIFVVLALFFTMVVFVPEVLADDYNFQQPYRNQRLCDINKPGYCIAQSFVPDKNFILDEFEVYIEVSNGDTTLCGGISEKKSDKTSDWLCSPDESYIDGSCDGWVCFAPPETLTLQAGTTYYLIVKNVGSIDIESGCYGLYQNVYLGGWASKYQSGWSYASSTYPNADFGFKISGHTNSAPSRPVISGSSTGTVNVEYEFTASSTDPDGDYLRYSFSIDNGPWTSYDTSNKVKHTWTTGGLKTVDAKARDEDGAESDPGEWLITISAQSKPQIKLTPSSYDFGSVEVGQFSDYPFTLQNVGTGTATGSVSLTGTDANQFSISSGGGSFSLSAGQSKTVNVKFCPTSEGYKSATLLADGSNCDDASSTLTGTGIGTGIINWPPIVKITYPKGGQYVSVGGIITITGNAADDRSMYSLANVKIDNSNWQSTNGVYQWSIDWDSTSVKNGKHTISAYITDNDGADSNIASVDVTVYNPDPDFFFIHISDLHLSARTQFASIWGGGTWKSFINRVKNMDPRPAFVLCTGDIFDRGETLDGDIASILFTNYGLDGKRITSDSGGWTLEGTDIPIFFCPGNHDSYGFAYRPLDDKFESYYSSIGDLYYTRSFPVGSHTVSIFSLTGGVDTEIDGMANGDGLADKYDSEVTRFKEHVANSDADIKIVIVHQGYVSPYDHGYFVNYNKHVNGDPNDDFGKWCSDNGVDLVCSGHVHVASILTKDDKHWQHISSLSDTCWKTNNDDTMYVITPELGANIIDPGKGGQYYRIIDVYSSGIKVTDDSTQFPSSTKTKIKNSMPITKQIFQSFLSPMIKNMFGKILYNQQQNQQYGHSSQQPLQMILKQLQHSR